MTMRARWLATLCLMMPPAGPAFAVLGEDVSMIAGDARRMNASRRVLPARTHSVHESEASTGTVVREYLGPDGKVFAVSWKGPHMPDLQQLFGQHFAAYQQLARIDRGQRGGISVESEDLVVQSGGRMRSFAGRAYLKGKLPAGVLPRDID
jgi:hypothetical protein